MNIEEHAEGYAAALEMVSEAVDTDIDDDLPEDADVDDVAGRFERELPAFVAKSSISKFHLRGAAQFFHELADALDDRSDEPRFS